MAKYLYAVPNAYPAGPYSLEELRKLLAAGRITASTLVSEETADNWVELWSLLAPMSNSRQVVANSQRTDGPRAHSQSTNDDLLRQLVDLQTKQLHWSRVTGLTLVALLMQILFLGFTVKFR